MPKNNYGDTVLHLLACRAFEDEVVNNPYIYVSEAMLICSSQEDFGVVLDKFVKDFPNILNETNDEGETPLLKAVDSNNLFCVKRLLESGANVSAKNKVTPRTSFAFGISC